MSNRHLARSVAMQILYQWDFKGKPTAALPAICDEQIKEFGEGLNEENKAFVVDTVHHVVDHIDEVDAVIREHAPNWPIEQMTYIDRNVLRIGVYEMRFSEAVPAKVAINEAIEIAKSYGGQSSGKFVNGILGAMYHHTEAPESPSSTV